MSGRKSRRQRAHIDTDQRALQRDVPIPGKWWIVSIPGAAIIGAALGYFFLSNTLPIAFRVLLGAFLVTAGLALLTFFLRGAILDPGAALSALFSSALESCQVGCCLYLAIAFIALFGGVSGLLFSHVLLATTLKNIANVIPYIHW
ncbi:hypothetical protein [Ktedonosporobacter rubrisoli]|uniref:hypothetical protein n=1 Tax=Ktedonosporobacter rubrisoli TaxID=2509675 RepID=UPI001F5DF4BA|nr:hypothetical protein [Ktedonosporobacter rubrisoli]